MLESSGFGNTVPLDGSSSISGGDTGGDANSALAELDQGLRCGRLGEQSEAIVRFPRLFQKYPFPILINSALLKLADIFRQSSNFIKLCVLRVCQESERHLDKITNVDEFVKRIYTVLHSNDPVARALTLRTLGAIAAIIPERKQVHHSIRNSLDSHDTVELHAAIYAAGKFAAQSKTFSVNMCSKISEMIQGYSTPLDMKLKLIPIFQHMHHDAQTAQVVRETCIAMLPAYPSQDFVLITLHTLTLLSAHTLVDIPDQVELLLQYLNTDCRKSIVKQVLSDLRFLANQDRAHLWKDTNVESVISFAARCDQNDAVLCGALAVLCDIVRHTSTRKFSLDNSNAPVLRLCDACCYKSNVSVAARSTQLLTLLASNCRKELKNVEGIDISAEAVMAIEALFLLINSGVHPSSNTVLKECLQCVVILCTVQPEACDQFVDIVGGMLLSANEPTMALLCEVLAALGNMKPGVLNLLLPDITHLMSSRAEEAARGPLRTKILILMANLLLQTQKGHAWTPEATKALEDTMMALDMWSCYRLARNATRYGHHGVAAKVFKKLVTGVSSEHLYFWLTGLSQMATGEMLLNDPQSDDLVDRLTSANVKIQEAVVSVKAATTQSRGQEFQIEYLRCRSEMLQTLVQLLYSCHSLRTSPPPAIASTQAKQTHDDLQRCGRITQLLRKSVTDFSSLGSMYGRLYETSFDADPDTLAQIQILQHLSLCISQWIEMTCLKSSLQGSIFDDLEIEFEPCLPKNVSEYGIDIAGLITSGKRVSDLFKRLSAQNVQPISNIHTDCLKHAVAVLCSAPLSIPRHFYQSLQQTSLKLAVTPQPRTAGEPIGVSSSQYLGIKVEGVITTADTLVAWRKVESVQLTLTSHLQSAAKANQDPNAKLPDCNQTIEQSAVPHNDFFTAQFLLPFPVAGLHHVTIETQLVDREERAWKTGLKSSLNVKAFEDNQNRPAGNRVSSR